MGNGVTYRFMIKDEMDGQENELNASRTARGSRCSWPRRLGRSDAVGSRKRAVGGWVGAFCGSPTAAALQAPVRSRHTVLPRWWCMSPSTRYSLALTECMASRRGPRLNRTCGPASQSKNVHCIGPCTCARLSSPQVAKWLTAGEKPLRPRLLAAAAAVGWGW